MSLQIPSLTPCPFCEYLNGTASCAFVWQGPIASAFLNPRQYERGALLVIPNEHVSSVTSTTDEQAAEVARLVRRVSLALDSVLDPTGINVFQNNGVPSGQTVPHCHVHVIPRYPHSERGRLFREQDFDITPLPELEAIAELIRGFLGKINGGAL